MEEGGSGRIAGRRCREGVQGGCAGRVCREGVQEVCAQRRFWSVFRERVQGGCAGRVCREVVQGRCAMRKCREDVLGGDRRVTHKRQEFNHNKSSSSFNLGTK